MKSKITIIVVMLLISINAIAQTTPCNSSQLPINLQTGLIAYFPFCGNANDESGNGNNGTVNGAALTTDRFGNANSAYSFNGINEDILVHDATSLRLSNTDYTISIWINEVTIDTAHLSLISKRNPPLQHAGWILFLDALSNPIGKVGLTISSYPDPVATSQTAPSFNTWTHIVEVYSLGSQIMKTYINGVLDNTTSAMPTPNAATSNNLYIGSDRDANEYFFNGKLDDIGMWNRALDSTEVQQLFTLTETSPCSSSQLSLNLQNGLLAYYPFCGNAIDESGNGHNGTVSGATLTTDRFGNPNSAYQFNGINNDILVNDATSLRLNNTDYTISAWINVVNIVDTAHLSIISKRNPPLQHAGWILFLDALSNPIGKVGLTISSYPDPVATSQTAPYLNTWTHIVEVYSLSSQIMKTYINGVLDNTTSAMPTPNGSTTNNLYIGSDRDANEYFFNGKIDDIGIWNRALDSLEVLQLYTDSLSTGITQNTFKEKISIYPNPSNGNFIIQLPSNPHNASISIYTVLGENVFKSEINNQKTILDISKQPSGMYFVKILDGEKVYSEKIVVE
jgi:concanavalin A-like lectin/glucanase superfamily protein/type IX secretion system substrate protein